MKKIIFLLLLLMPVNVFALADQAKSSILIEAETGTIIFDKNSSEMLPMASMTKMMSMLIVMEKLNDGSISLDDEVTISKNAASMGGSQVYLEENSKMKLETLLKSVAIASANDSITALAEHIYGSTDEFVKKMNEKAEKLGLADTHFMNVHGLDEKDHYSSAHDMAFIAKELLKYDDILNYSSIYEDYIKHPNGKSTWIVNTNKLINYYDGLDGLKTGFTDNSGYCITATAKKNNMRLISVVMGEVTNEVRNKETIELLNYGFANYKLNRIIPSDSVLGSINIIFGKKNNVKLKLTRSASMLNKVGENKSYSYEVIRKKVKAPVKIGEEVGNIKIYEGDKVIDTIPLTIKEDVKKRNYFELIIYNLNKFVGNITN